MNRKVFFVATLLTILISLFGCFAPEDSQQTKKQEDKSKDIASWIQENVNVEGYTGCKAKSIGNQIVRVDLNFPAGTNTVGVEIATKGVAEKFAQVGRLASTIYYHGYSGSQKVCEYKYDMYDGMVKKVK